ncbi:MAG: hypothetical protein BWZ07_02891 [Alphaproteobacteria bacterium ADurb.BinA280]|jgi:hypothetical protein|nr:hypothetical protein [Xanthomonadales bacterium]MCC6506907.1 hypothetical protein [Aquimonas sp.]OPZ10014.1 MAG: hypothetical protein BWZ07_02891 [Alphaproteobacteria bacterium ADurb.BinA280]
MSDAYAQLGERFPPRALVTAGPVPVDAKGVAAWVDALPRANQQATLQQLINAFQVWRGAAMIGVQRATVMEAVRPVALESIALIERALQSATFPLTPQRAQMAETCQSLHRELALGYRMALHEFLAPSGSVPFLRGGAAAGLAVRSAWHYSRLLMLSYFLYRVPPEDNWFGLHAIYRFCDHAGLLAKQVQEVAESAPRTVAQLYQQAVLLALSNPYRFSQREQGELWSLTRELGSLLQLSNKPGARDSFMIAIDTDRGPGYTPEERESGTALGYWFCVQPLRDVLDAPLAQAGVESVAIKLPQLRVPLQAPADLLRRLRAGWATAAERRARRLGATHHLDTVLGLIGLHFYLAGGLDFDTFTREIRGYSSQAAAERASWANASTDSVRASRAKAMVLDQSLGGYRLQWPREAGLRIRVGELIGLSIAHEEDDPLWMVGVVRWIRYASDGSVDAGVELLARRARAVSLRTLDPLGHPKAPQRGVLIDWLRERGDPDAVFVVAPSQIDLQAHRLEVSTPSEVDAVDPDASSTHHYHDMNALEQAGDYVLLKVRQTRTEVSH